MTAGFKSLSDLGSLSSSGWAKTHRPCTANGSSRLDLAECFLVYIAHLRAVPSCRQAARQTLLAAEHGASFIAVCSGRLCFHCESIHGPFNIPTTKTIRRSKEDSTSASTATLSPVEQQRDFGQLSTINENSPTAEDTLSASTESMGEQRSPTKLPHSWLTSFLVDAHLSAPNRCWEASSSGASNPHAGSNSNHPNDSIVSMDRA